jgi:hypothetical protein
MLKRITVSIKPLKPIEKLLCGGGPIPTPDEYPPGTFDFGIPEPVPVRCLSKRESEPFNSRLLGSRGAKPLQQGNVLEKINGVEQIRSTRVCNLNILFEGY